MLPAVMTPAPPLPVSAIDMLFRCSAFAVIEIHRLSLGRHPLGLPP
jgi:hypothetical protein